MRAIIWNTKDCVFKDDDGNDIFVSAKLEGKKRQQTDIHWRSQDGKGAFNCKIYFDSQNHLFSKKKFKNRENDLERCYSSNEMATF